MTDIVNIKMTEIRAQSGNMAVLFAYHKENSGEKHVS